MTRRGIRGVFWAGVHVPYFDLDAGYKLFSLNEICLTVKKKKEKKRNWSSRFIISITTCFRP